LDDRHAPADAESLGGYAQAWCRLMAFPFVEINASLDPTNG
jgi:hypothetical protein